MVPGPAINSQTGGVTFALGTDTLRAPPPSPAAPYLPSLPPVHDQFTDKMYTDLTCTRQPLPAIRRTHLDRALNGSFSSIKSQLTNTFSEPLTQSVTLGSHLYSVTIHPTTMSLAPSGTQGREGHHRRRPGGGRGGVQGNGGPVHGGGPTVGFRPGTFHLRAGRYRLLLAAVGYGWRRYRARFLALASA